MDGGYDVGYKACPCFWGKAPGSLVRKLVQGIGDVRGLSVIDVGCGEGKNAVWLSEQGALVRAIDISEFALENARKAWPMAKGITWELADVRGMRLPNETYDLVIAYGLFHCLSNVDEISCTVKKLQEATKVKGYHAICSFNSRFQDLSAHPAFQPCLVQHEAYLGFYSGWSLLSETDTDLTETHPHNNIRHTHSLTRILAQKLVAS